MSLIYKLKNHRNLMSTAVLSALTVFSMNAYAADNSAEIIELARQEAKDGTFSIMVSSPKSERAHRKIMDAFQERFDIKVDWEWTPLTSTVSAPRVLQQAQSDLPVPSAIGGYGYNTYKTWFVEHDLDATVKWVEEFGEIFPGIEQPAVEGVLPSYRDRMLRQWDVQYVMVYNTDLVKPDQLPKSIADLALPEWKGQFAIANNTPPPLDILAVDMGVDGVVDLTKKLLANEPRFKAGPPAVVGAISSGEVAVGVSGYTALAEALKQQGAPIDWVPLDILPIGPLFVFMLEGAPQPNLGKLFLAWLVTEGAAITEREEQLSLFSNEDSAVTKKIREVMPNVKVVEVRTDEELALSNVAAKRIMDEVAGIAGK